MGFLHMRLREYAVLIDHCCISQYLFFIKGMHVNTPFPSQEAPVGQVSGVSNSSPWPFMDRQVKIPVHPGRSPVEPIGHMKQSKGIPMENRSPNFTMSGMQMQSPGMHMSTASGEFWNCMSRVQLLPSKCT